MGDGRLGRRFAGRGKIHPVLPTHPPRTRRRHPTFPAKRILLVEDDAEVCDVLAFLLGREGYEVRPALSMGEATAQRGRFDLYVIDRQLPDGDGLDLCRALKRQHSGARVVIYSGSALPEDHRAAYAAGADAYVNKPHLSHLAKTVKDQLR